MDMSLSNLWELVMDREALHAAVHIVAKSWIQLNYLTELNWSKRHQISLTQVRCLWLPKVSTDLGFLGLGSFCPEISSPDFPTSPMNSKSSNLKIPQFSESLFDAKSTCSLGCRNIHLWRKESSSLFTHPLVSLSSFSWSNSMVFKCRTVPWTNNEAKGYVSAYSPEPALWEEEENEQFTQPSGFFHSIDIA